MAVSSDYGQWAAILRTGSARRPGLKSVRRERKWAETLVFYWCFGPWFRLALGALGW